MLGIFCAVGGLRVLKNKILASGPPVKRGPEKNNFGFKKFIRNYLSDCHTRTSCSRRCELVDTHALSLHRSRVLICRRFSLLVSTGGTNFC